MFDLEEIVKRNHLPGTVNTTRMSTDISLDREKKINPSALADVYFIRIFFDCQ